MTQRSDQLASAIDRAVRDVLIRGFHDPRISGLITVTGVKVTQDGREAFVGISVYPAEKSQLTIHGLQNAAAFIRREVGDMIRIRTMPQLTFQLDESLKKQAEVIAALEKVKAEQKPSQGQANIQRDEAPGTDEEAQS